MKSIAILFLSIAAIAQTPSVPVLQPVSTPAVAQVNVISDIGGCQDGSTACGLSDCRCWVQLYRAQCSTAASCPAATTSAPYSFVSTAQITSANSNGSGMHYVLLDTDSVLATGTIWQYFETANFALASSNVTGISNTTGPVTLPGTSAGPVNFQVQLAWDNSKCVTGNTCAAHVYRAACGNTTPCPSYASSPGSFAALADNSTQTVSASNTHFVALDTGAAPNPLANNTLYTYAVLNSFTANPSVPGQPSQINLTTPTGIHGAILNWSNASCRTTSPCSIQVYRATCTSATSCPAYTAGSASWKALSMATGLTSNPAAQGTSWQYADNDTALAGSTTYAWVAVNSYSGASTTSAASAAFIGTTAVGRTIKIKAGKEK